MAHGLTELPSGIELRPTEPTDRDFLLSVFESSRADELAIVAWSEADRRAFVVSQFDAQDTYYRQTYPDGQFLVILLDGELVGRLYLGRIDDELRVIDIALLPDHRGRGIGTSLLAWVTATRSAPGRSRAIRASHARVDRSAAPGEARADRQTRVRTA